MNEDKSTVKLSPRQENAKNNGKVYSSRLLKGGAVLDDMRSLVRSWNEEASWDEQRQHMILENVLGKKTRSRALDVYQDLFLPRFLKGNPGSAWKIVRPLEERNLPIEILRPVYYWITARSESLLYDFVLDEILPRSRGHDLSVRMDETTEWIKKKISKVGQSWSDAVTLRVAQGLLAALRDFGLLEGGSKKRIAPAYLPIEAFSYIAFVLYNLGSSGENLITHSDWKLFLMSPPVIERLFLDAHQNKLLNYQAAGKIHRIEFFADSLEEMADVISGRTTKNP
jgi:hypothetical protein